MQTEIRILNRIVGNYHYVTFATGSGNTKGNFNELIDGVLWI